MTDKFQSMNLTPTSKKVSYLIDASHYQGVNLSGFLTVKQEVEPTLDELLADKLKIEKQKIIQESERLSAIGSQLSMALSALAGEKAEYFAKLKSEATLLAMTVAQKMIGEELKANPAIIENCIHSLLNEIDASEKKVLEVNTADWDLLSNEKLDFINSLKSQPNLEIKTTDDVPVGVIRLGMENQVLETGPMKKMDHLWGELVSKGYLSTER